RSRTARTGRVQGGDRTQARPALGHRPQIRPGPLGRRRDRQDRTACASGRRLVGSHPPPDAWSSEGLRYGDSDTGTVEWLVTLTDVASIATTAWGFSTSSTAAANSSPTRCSSRTAPGHAVQPVVDWEVPVDRCRPRGTM